MQDDGNSRVPNPLGYAPFAGAAVLAWIAVLVGSKIAWDQYALATLLLGLTGALRLAGRPRSWPGRTLPSLVFLAAVGLLRNSAGGISSGVSAVALITVFYTALYSDGRRDLYVTLAGLSAFFLVPILLVGPPDYPDSQYRAALLSVAVGSIIGLATQRLVANVRGQAEEARSRERMLDEVSKVMRDLFASSQPRLDVCEAAKRIGQAVVAVLYEPIPGSSAMRSTAIAGLDALPIEIPAAAHSAVRDAFASRRAVFVSENAEAHVGSHDLWEASGRPASALYEPLLRGAESIGVLAVGWPGAVRAQGSRATVVEMLAHEAAAVITRADTMSELTDISMTDPLTGLPNRRAWDARVAQALDDGQGLTVAMLDFDHFKDYNDTYGHPAGDRLLKETAAAWRDQLRSNDLLARLGGEEFGLLLLDCDTAHAIDVIERLRGSVSNDRTCSVGFAAQRRGESADDVMARADAALYDAKASGRDRACMSA